MKFRMLIYIRLLNPTGQKKNLKIQDGRRSSFGKWKPSFTLLHFLKM